MFFVVHKKRLDKIISIVREDRTAKSRSADIPYLRLEAKEDKLTISSNEASATFPCTVYESGVLFIKTTNFRRVLKTTKIDNDFLSFQITKEGVNFADVHYDFASLNMVLYSNVETAPASWPPPVPESEMVSPRNKQLDFDFDREY